MSFTLSQIKQQAEAARSVHEAAMEATEGGGSKHELQAGTALAVVTSYIETGDHEVKSGKSKGKVNSKGFMELRLFDVAGKSDGLYTQTMKNKDGTEEVYGSVIRHNFNNISRNELSNFRKDFDKLCDAAGIEGATSMMDLLGKTFIVDLVENESNGKTYINLDLDRIRPNHPTDPVTGNVDTTQMVLPLPVSLEELPYKMFLWEAPTVEAWDSLFVDGTREVEKDGKKVEVSKNWLQELIMSAVNYIGSPLESVLINAENTGEALPKAKKEEKPAEAAPEAAESVSKEAKVETPATGEEHPEIADLIAARDGLAAVGMPTEALDAKIAEKRAELGA